MQIDIFSILYYNDLEVSGLNNIDISKLSDWKIDSLSEDKRIFFDNISQGLGNNSRIKYLNALIRLEYFESILNKKLPDFSVDEIALVLKYNNKGRLASNHIIRTTYTVLLKYVKVLLFKASLAKAVKKARDQVLKLDNNIQIVYVKDYNHLYNYIIKYFPFLKDQNPYYFVFILLIYCGLSPEQIMNIRISDIDKNNRRIVNDSYSIILNRLPLSIIELVEKAECYDRYYSGFTKLSLEDSDYLIKIHNEDKNRSDLATSYQQKVCMFFNEVEQWDFLEEPAIHFSVTNTRKSGQFYKLYEYELDHNPVGYISQRQYNKLFPIIFGEIKSHGANFYLEYENWRETYYS